MSDSGEVRVWQVGSGDFGRRGENVFRGKSKSTSIKSGGFVAIGPGQYGDWVVNASHYENAQDLTKRRKGQLRDFCQEDRQGDVVILKEGLKALAIGVLGPYRYMKTEFDGSPYFSWQLGGWDLVHVRAVAWADEESDESIEKALGKCLSRQAFCRVGSLDPQYARSIAKTISVPTLRDFPKVKRSELRPASLVDLRIPDKQQREAAVALKIAKQYLEDWNWSRSEREMIGHVVVPLLRGLGWDPRQIRMEWRPENDGTIDKDAQSRRVDVAVFNEHRANQQGMKQCQIIFEGKKRGQPLRAAAEQAWSYKRNFYLEHASVVVTDGDWLWLVDKDPVGQDDDYCPDAFLRLSRSDSQSDSGGAVHGVHPERVIAAMTCQTS